MTGINCIQERVQLSTSLRNTKQIYWHPREIKVKLFVALFLISTSVLKSRVFTGALYDMDTARVCV